MNKMVFALAVPKGHLHYEPLPILESFDLVLHRKYINHQTQPLKSQRT